MDKLKEVNDQLMNHGCYSPFEWLLDQGHLPYHHYESWRMGELVDLDEKILLPQIELINALQYAETSAQKLGLIAEPKPQFNWNTTDTDKPLKVSQSATLNRLLSTHWTRQQEESGQFDLFMDNPALVAENNLISALVNRQWQQAENHLNQLYQHAANHPHLGEFEDLVAYGLHTDNRLIPGTIDEERQGLEQEITPLARKVLKQASRDYLASGWQRIALALADQHNNNESSAMHESYAWEKMQNWEKVKQSILEQTNYQQNTELLYRLACAVHFNKDRVQGLLTLCLASAKDIDYVGLQLDKPSDSPFAPIWNDFWDLEEELDAPEFPAWLLLSEPGLAHHIDDEFICAVNQPAFEAIYSLLKAKSQGETAKDLDSRKKLQATSPVLLDIYLQKFKQI